MFKTKYQIGWESDELFEARYYYVYKKRWFWFNWMKCSHMYCTRGGAEVRMELLESRSKGE